MSTGNGLRSITSLGSHAKFKEEVNKKIADFYPVGPFINKISSNIDITFSYAGLKGYLGEVRAHLILREVFGENSAVHNAGAIKGFIESHKNKHEIPIDTIVRTGLNVFHF